MQNVGISLQMILSTLAMQLPTTLIVLAACIVVLMRWRHLGRGAIWALAGFGLALVLGFVVPVVQSLVQSWVIQAHELAHKRAIVLSGLSIIWSLLRAATYVLLLLALLAGRERRAEATPV